MRDTQDQPDRPVFGSRFVIPSSFVIRHSSFVISRKSHFRFLRIGINSLPG